MPMLFTTGQREKYVRKMMEEGGAIARRKNAPDILQDLLKNTNHDTNTINDLVKSYVNEGKTELPNMMPEGVQGPLAQDQLRETPTNSLRRPAYVYDETSDTFSRAPEGVYEPTNQVMRVNNPPRATAAGSTAPRGNWYMDESGKWRRYVPREGEASGRPTAAQEQVRLSIESAIAQLKSKKAIKKSGTSQFEEPITTRDEALSVPVGLGLDPERYPEIQKALDLYPEQAPVEPEQPGFFDDFKAGVGSAMRGGARAIGATGKALGNATENIIRPRQEPVQPRKQDAMNGSNSQAPRIQRNKKTGQRRVSYDGGKTWQLLK